jgi:hypothetical protein
MQAHIVLTIYMHGGHAVKGFQYSFDMHLDFKDKGHFMINQSIKC